MSDNVTTFPGVEKVTPSLREAEHHSHIQTFMSRAEAKEWLDELAEKYPCEELSIREEIRSVDGSIQAGFFAVKRHGDTFGSL
jgi:hypothetical protein